jgi:hypothetical protein
MKCPFGKSTVAKTISLARHTSQIWDDKLYMPSYDNTTLEIFDLRTNKSRTVTMPINTGCQTSQVWNDKLYIVGGTTLLIGNLQTI